MAGLLPARPDNSNKGTFGKVLVVAGSARYVGAAALAAGAAVRAGAGLVTLAVPATVQRAVAGTSPEATYLPLPDDPHTPGLLHPGHAEAILDTADGYDALAIGPGVGDHPQTQRLVLDLAARLAGSESAPPVVFDADALNALAGAGEWPRPPNARWVLTPHPGEMGRLRRRTVAEVQGDRLGTALASARDWGQVVVLKGAPSIIAAPDGPGRPGLPQPLRQRRPGHRRHGRRPHRDHRRAAGPGSEPLLRGGRGELPARPGGRAVAGPSRRRRAPRVAPDGPPAGRPAAGPVRCARRRYTAGMSSEPPPAESEPEARTAADLMDRQPPAVLPDATVGDVARLIVERHVSGVPVVASSGEVVGLVTEADLVARHAHLNFPTYLSLFGMAIPIDTIRRRRELDAETRRVVARTAAEIMTEKFSNHAVTEDTPLEDVAERLSKDGLNPLVVLRGDRLAGLITRTDLVRLVAVEEAEEADRGGRRREQAEGA